MKPDYMLNRENLYTRGKRIIPVGILLYNKKVFKQFIKKKINNNTNKKLTRKCMYNFFVVMKSDAF